MCYISKIFFPMRTLYLFACTLFVFNAFAQVPAMMPYQAVARDQYGQVLSNTSLSARFTLHDGAANGPSIWQELRNVTSNAQGLFTVQLGSNVSLADVNWAVGSKYMEVEIDLGQGFVQIGAQQLLSVPYALYAGSVPLNISPVGDTLFLGSREFVIIPGISTTNVNGGIGSVSRAR